MLYQECSKGHMMRYKLISNGEGGYTNYICPTCREVQYIEDSRCGDIDYCNDEW